MDLSIENIINNKIVHCFKNLDLDLSFAIAKISDRPDLSDFQCNAALGLAKKLGKNPREIATNIAEELKKDTCFVKISVDGPGFINLSLSDEFIAQALNNIAKDANLGCAKINKPKNIVLDFGGPNVAKEMHVGHLRPAVIGESIQRIERFVGNNVISDVHLGDWGTPMGMIIAQILVQDKNLDKALNYNVQEITELYKAASLKCKEDEALKETARQITAQLQDENQQYRKVWQHLRDVSVEAIKENYEVLDINFDLWLGESDAHEAAKEVIQIAKDKGILELDDGAHIIRLEESNKPKPPVMMTKSDGGFGYHVTDIATIKMRVDDLRAEEIVYVADARQNFHFEQVFEASQMLGIAPNVKFKHIGFGTMNGKDGKPFKTRDGGVMNLEALIAMAQNKVVESMPEPTAEYDEKYIKNLIDEIAVAGIKFQDLKNNIASGYNFDLDDFAKFEGKTGPYIQYAIARINSILRKANFADGEIVISNQEERNLALKISQLNSAIWRAKTEYEPSIIADYAYTLAQSFSSFYASSSIMNEENQSLAASRLALAKLVRDILVLLLNLLGIKSPEIMLKKIS